ncbi:MAG: hypothetical protein A3H32_18650 [Betaproteobacteria bacterium RIFCSPLOWO2_02_FULL_63_19]|nr:MAG: hypothetical protein A3H32_18650 [Betaproteobacteria bacterium RIFCSPLOWO2_02_FULL_63_19]
MSVFYIKYVHIVAIAVAFALFFVKGIWVLQSYPDSQERWARAVPNIAYAVVAVSAVLMLLESPLKGWPGNWLTVKLVLVAVFAVLSVYLFRVARATIVKMLVWILALGVFLFVTTIAVLRDPIGIFSVL